jgi:molybdopterin converting factor subunit 1
MKLNVRLFGIVREIVAKSELEVELPEQSTAKDLLTFFKVNYVELHDLTSLLVAVNQEYVPMETILKASDEIVLIPPVSGG